MYSRSSDSRFMPPPERASRRDDRRRARHRRQVPAGDQAAVGRAGSRARWRCAARGRSRATGRRAATPRASREMPGGGTAHRCARGRRGTRSASTRMSSRRSRSGGIADLEDAETVVEVLAKRLPRDRRRQIAVGCRDDADVGAQRARAAEALELALLQHAQELGLHQRAHLADLVEERARRRRPARSRPGLVAIAPVNAPFSWPNSSDLEQLLRERRAVDRDERLVAARRALVDEARERPPCRCPTRR